MREWQVGDPIGDGNDIGVPDIKYMDYLKNNDYRNGRRKNKPNSSDINKSKKFQEEAIKLWKENNLSDALTYINSAIYYNPNDDENWNVKGIILWEMADDEYDFDNAVECFDNALLINPNEIIKSNKARCMMDCAMSYLTINYSDLAMKQINETLSFISDDKCEDYARALNIKSRIFYAKYNTDCAIECINKAIKILPNDEIFQNNREVYISRFGADEDTLLDVVDYNIRSGNYKKASKYYYELGFKFEYKENANENDKEKAVKYHKKAVEFDSDNKEALTHLGYSLKDLKRYSEAIPYFKRVKTGDVMFDCTWDVANCYMELGEYKSAIPYLEECIQQQPLRHDWVEQEVECLLALNKNREAIKVFSDFSDYLKSEGRYFESIKYIDEILKIEPNNSYFLNKKEKMLNNDRILRLYNLINTIESTERPNRSLEDEDLKSYIETVSESSGESIGYILSLYQEDNPENYDYKDRCQWAFPIVYWDRLISMYPKPESPDSLDSPTIIPLDENDDSDNKLTSTDNKATIIDFNEENENKSNNADDETIIIEPEEELSIKNEDEEVQPEEETEEENENKLNNIDNETIIIEPEEELSIKNEDEEVQPEEETEEENENINYLSKIKEAKDLLDKGTITQEEYNELKLKYLSLI